MIEAVNHIVRMAPYALADKGMPGSISLAENESAFPPSEKAIAAALSAATAARIYSDPNWC
jgi:histidinol-phosphate aminotransferase